MRKGGSIASNAVSGLVTDGAYNTLSKNFSNNLAPCKGGKKTGGSGRKTGGSGRKTGGSDVFTTVSNAVTRALSGTRSEGFNVFRSNSAPVNAGLANLRGQVSRPVSGGKLQARNIAHYMNNSSEYNIKNKRGGATSQIGLDYSIIPTTSKLQGNVPARELSNAVVQLKASENVSSFPALAKDAHYGSVTNTANKFSYAGIDRIIQGGKRRKPRAKKPVKKPVAKKPKARKPKAKKCAK